MLLGVPGGCTTVAASTPTYLTMLNFKCAWRRSQGKPCSAFCSTPSSPPTSFGARMQNRAFCLEIMQITCPTCAASFTPNRPWQKFCAPKCRNNAPDKKPRTQAHQQARKDLLSKLKVDRGCVMCGYNAHPAALDFNHIHGEKSFSISQDPKVAWHKLIAEIDKCEILCANCHRVHTYENRHWRTKRKDKVAI